jgi:hypothetical protein
MPDQNGTDKKGFRGLLDKLQEKLKDVTTLDVVTATGTLEYKVDDKGKFDFKTMVDQLKNSTAADSKLKIVAITHSEIDHDTFNFIQEGANPDHVELHNQSVDIAKKARHAFIEFLANLIGV